MALFTTKPHFEVVVPCWNWRMHLMMLGTGILVMWGFVVKRAVYVYGPLETLSAIKSKPHGIYSIVV